MVQITDDLWPIIRTHPWKFKTGRQDVVGILWHATRSGIWGRTAAQEYSSTVNWFVSPNNVVKNAAGQPWYSGMSSYLIGGGKIARAVPEELVPTFSAGVHDFRAISVEVGQNNNGVPYDSRDIELCHELAGELSSKYNFALGKLPFVDGNNNGWPGEVGHEDTAQGRSQGKSDPGDQFWFQYLQEEDMSPDEVRTIIREELANFNFGGLHRTLERKYWTDINPDTGLPWEGDFTAPPDPDVIAAIGKAIGTGIIDSSGLSKKGHVHMGGTTGKDQ